ncbi:MAG: TraR/DksA family transcriptional regulator [Acidimicrobiales bacterium]
MTVTSGLSRRDVSDAVVEPRAHLRALLVDEVGTNEEQAVAYEATARELAGHLDPDSTIEREIAEACAGRARAAAEEARDALRRFDDGTYGICERCGTRIPPERLEIIPQTPCCVACAGQRSGLLSTGR